MSKLLAILTAAGLMAIPVMSGGAAARLAVERRPSVVLRPVQAATVADSRTQSAASFPAAAVSASQADRIALQAVGGGTVRHTSADHMGTKAVWDVHVLRQGRLLDVKVSQSTGAVVRQKLSSEQPGRGGGRESTGAGSDTSTAPVVVNGITFDKKLSAAPAAYTTYVNQAISAVNGTSLKWVRFQREGQGEYQMNIKIRLTGATTKVTDVFRWSGQLVEQKRQTDN